MRKSNYSCSALKTEELSITLAQSWSRELHRWRSVGLLLRLLLPMSILSCANAICKARAESFSRRHWKICRRLNLRGESKFGRYNTKLRWKRERDSRSVIHRVCRILAQAGRSSLRLNYIPPDLNLQLSDRNAKQISPRVPFEALFRGSRRTVRMTMVCTMTVIRSDSPRQLPELSWLPGTLAIFISESPDQNYFLQSTSYSRA